MRIFTTFNGRRSRSFFFFLSVLKTSAKFTRHHLRRNLFLTNLQVCTCFSKSLETKKPETLFKKSLRLRCINLNFVQFYRTPFYRTLLHSMKTSENIRLSAVFRGYGSGILVKNGLRVTHRANSYK